MPFTKNTKHIKHLDIKKPWIIFAYLYISDIQSLFSHVVLNISQACYSLPLKKFCIVGRNQPMQICHVIPLIKCLSSPTTRAFSRQPLLERTSALFSARIYDFFSWNIWMFPHHPSSFLTSNSSQVLVLHLLLQLPCPITTNIPSTIAWRLRSKVLSARFLTMLSNCVQSGKLLEAHSSSSHVSENWPQTHSCGEQFSDLDATKLVPGIKSLRKGHVENNE